MRSLIFFGLFYICSGTAAFAAETAAAQARTISLKEALQRAPLYNSDFISKLTLIDQATARQSQASAAGFPKVLGTAVLSPIYKTTGNAINSENDLSTWGAWLQSSITILQPIYTWGKLSSLREAASRGVEISRAQNQKDRMQLRYEVKEIYYGAVLAEQLFSFLEDGKQEIDQILEKIENEKEKKKSNTLPKRDYYRLKIFAAEAPYRLTEAKKLRDLARHALSLQLGFDPSEPTLPEDTALKAIDGAPPTEDELYRKMKETKPELAQLSSGIAAKQALLNVERTNKYPIFFLGGMLTFSYSNVRTGQQSAFAFDPYNRSSGGVGAGVQWSWDFATTLANEALIRSEIDELEKKEIYAKSGFRLELKKSLGELLEAISKLKKSEEAMQTGRRWLVSETMGQSLGVGEIKNLVDAYLARAKTAKDHWETLFQINMAWAGLSKTVGQEITPGLQDN